MLLNINVRYVHNMHEVLDSERIHSKRGPRIFLPSSLWLQEKHLPTESPPDGSEQENCYITANSAMAASQNEFCSYKLSIHKNTNSMQIMTKILQFLFI